MAPPCHHFSSWMSAIDGIVTYDWATIWKMQFNAFKSSVHMYFGSIIARSGISEHVYNIP